MDLTVLATPLYFGAMAVEHAVLRRRAARTGAGPADYTREDTLASLSMGVGSLLVVAQQRALTRLVPGRTRAGTGLVALAGVAAVATTVADRRTRRRARRAMAGRAMADPPAPDGAGPDQSGVNGVVPHGTAPAVAAAPSVGHVVPVAPADRLAEQVSRVGGVTAVVAGSVALMAGAQHLASSRRQWSRRWCDLGTGPLAWAVALVGWDLVYYLNHRLMHEVRALWAVHVVHHSSERFNLSTALRQPVAGALGVWVPYGALARLGVRPSLIEHSRAVNLLYQFWIHTDVVRSLGRAEQVLNSPSHHRVHHGSNGRYLDRNHGGILIVWDRLLGTFQAEDPDDPPVYGLTRNIGTFNPVRIVTHEYADLLADVAASTTWRDRLSFVVRGPGWAYRRRAERAAGAAADAVDDRIAGHRAA